MRVSKECTDLRPLKFVVVDIYQILSLISMKFADSH